jgi:hypothetical protein
LGAATALATGAAFSFYFSFSLTEEGAGLARDLLAAVLEGLLGALLELITRLSAALRGGLLALPFRAAEALLRPDDFVNRFTMFPREAQPVARARSAPVIGPPRCDVTADNIL